MAHKTNLFKIKLLVVDDSPADLKTICTLLSRLSFVRIVAKETSSLAAYDYALHNPVDVLLSDMVMDDLDGINLIEALPNRPEVIFVSAYSEEAARSYKSRVKYWLQKPVSFALLKETLEEIYGVLSKRCIAGPQDSIFVNIIQIEDEKLKIKRKLRVRFRFDEISAFTTKENYIILIKTDGDQYTFRSTLTQLMPMLDQALFKRVHKGYVVNVDNCLSMGMEGKNNIVYVKGYDTAIPLNESGLKVMKVVFGMPEDDLDEGEE